MKLVILHRGVITMLRRAPQGARGLKFIMVRTFPIFFAVAPRTGRVG